MNAFQNRGDSIRGDFVRIPSFSFKSSICWRQIISYFQVKIWNFFPIEILEIHVQIMVPKIKSNIGKILQVMSWLILF